MMKFVTVIKFFVDRVFLILLKLSVDHVILQNNVLSSAFFTKFVHLKLFTPVDAFEANVDQDQTAQIQ